MKYMNTIWSYFTTIWRNCTNFEKVSVIKWRNCFHSFYNFKFIHNVIFTMLPSNREVYCCCYSKGLSSRTFQQSSCTSSCVCTLDCPLTKYDVVTLRGFWVISWRKAIRWPVVYCSKGKLSCNLWSSQISMNYHFVGTDQRVWGRVRDAQCSVRLELSGCLTRPM